MPHETYFELFVDSSWVCPDVNKQSVNELGGILCAGVYGPFKKLRYTYVSRILVRLCGSLIPSTTIDKLLRGLLGAFLQQTDLRRLGPRHTYPDIIF